MKWAVVQLLYLYQRYISLDRGLMGKIVPHRGTTCRFDPSCSTYAIEAVERFGVIKGGWMAARRVGRCHPWGGWGYDPVPTK